MKTVRQAVIAWGQRLTERPQAPAAVLAGHDAARQRWRGHQRGAGGAAHRARCARSERPDVQASAPSGSPWPRVSALHIIELYLDRANEAWRSLQDARDCVAAFYAVIRSSSQGSARCAVRPMADIVARSTTSSALSCTRATTRTSRSSIRSTRSARAAKSAHKPHSCRSSGIWCRPRRTAPNADQQIGRTLFNLLVPVDLEPFMGSSAATVIQLDSGTAAIPWELLDSVTPSGSDDIVHGRFARSCSGSCGPDGPARSRTRPPTTACLSSAIPHATGNAYPRLFGARREAMAVAECLWHGSVGHDSRTVRFVTSLISPQDYSGMEPDANDRHQCGDEPCVANHPHRRPR